MSEATATLSSTGAYAGLSEPERVLDAFVAPGKTFRDILRKASWWLPFLLACIVSIAVTFTIDRKVGYERVAENQMHASPKQEEMLQGMKPEQRQAQLAKMGVGYRYSSYASPIFILVFSAIGALVLWGSANFGLGAATTFQQMFALWMYASLPRLLTGLLTIVTLLVGANTEGFDLKNPVGTNLAYYMPDASPAVRTALSFVDVIGLWSLLLLILGTAIVGKVSRGKAAGVVVGLWLVGLVVSVAITAALG